MEQQPVEYEDLGMIAYKEAWEYQEVLMQKNVAAKLSARQQEEQLLKYAGTKNYFLCCEHPPVYTIGKNGSDKNLLISEQQLQEKQIELFHINRGGDITFHGPGQIVGYPILDLEKFYTDLGRYLFEIEEVIIRTLAEYNITAGRSKGETGVWINPGNAAAHLNPARKICAIGIRCSRWVTMHGFALNVNTDLDYFNNIIPCGIADKQVTSIQKELSQEVDMNEVKEKICRHFEAIFHVSLLQAVDTQ